jgi:phosphate-selective porin
MSSEAMRRCAVAAMSLFAVLGTSASAAPGDRVYSGTTAEGTKVRLIVASLGNATAFKIGATEAVCDVGRLEIDAAKFKNFDTSDPGTFADKRRSKTKDGNYLLRDTFKIAGQLTADDGVWTGTYDKTTKVYKGGKLVDTCVVSTTWEVQ